jgi:hypothetical protein
MAEDGRKCQCFRPREFVWEAATVGRGADRAAYRVELLPIGLKVGEKRSFVHRNDRCAG